MYGFRNQTKQDEKMKNGCKCNKNVRYFNGISLASLDNLITKTIYMSGFFVPYKTFNLIAY